MNQCFTINKKVQFIFICVFYSYLSPLTLCSFLSKNYPLPTSNTCYSNQVFLFGVTLTWQFDFEINWALFIVINLFWPKHNYYIEIEVKKDLSHFTRLDWLCRLLWSKNFWTDSSPLCFVLSGFLSMNNVWHLKFNSQKHL